MSEAVERTLVVRDSLAARQWEAVLIAERERRSQVAPSPELKTRDAWLTDLAREAGSADAELVSPAQADALWRRVIADAAQGEMLLEHRGAAGWAAEAWRLLADAEVDPAALSAGPDQADFAAFLEWCRDYRARLEAANWQDGATARFALRLRELPRARHTTLLDIASDDLRPVEASTVDRLRARGGQVETRCPPSRKAQCCRVACRDRDTEIESALRWAAARVRRSPGARVAVVLHDSSAQEALVDRVLMKVATDRGENQDPLETLVRRRRRDRPLVAAACDALELLSPRGRFTHLSRWLRGPLVVGTDVEASAQAALLELDIRGRVLAQVDFVHAYRFAGLRSRFTRHAPSLAQRIDAALVAIGADRGRRSPAHWATVWQRALGALGFGDAVKRLDTEDLAVWERAVEEFVALTAIVGRLDLSTALNELGALLATLQHDGAFPLSGVHVLDRLEQIGPGFDAAWITGLTDSRLPEPVQLNPLLPRGLQVAQRMPRSTPADALMRAGRCLDGVKARVDQLVLSWSTTEFDFETAASPLISSAPPIDLKALLDGSSAPCATPPPELVSVYDAPRAQPDWLVRGGAQTLNLQARCPLRAYCQSRLGARSMDPPERGLSPRHQGIAVHRALELLLARHPEAAELGDLDTIVDRALQEVFRGARRPLAALYALEHARIRRLIERFIEAEARRQPHAPEQLEARCDIDVSGVLVRARIDRIDRLADGSLVVIDYKTGRRVQRPGWFEERLEDPQLPLYLLDAGPRRVEGIVIIALEPSETRYIGVWCETDAFPARPLALPEGRSWAAQRKIWEAQLGTLVRELSSGDVRLFPDDLDYAQGAYAPLSRVAEALSMTYRSSDA